MRHRAKKLVVYIIVTMLICQLCGTDMIESLAATIEVSKNETITVDSSDDYVFASGGAKTLTISSGTTLSGDIDFSNDAADSSNTLKNSGTITGNIITGNTTALLYNYGTISSGSFNLATGSTLYNTGSITSVTMEGGALEATGGSIGVINDNMSSYILLSGCSVGTLTTTGSIVVSGNVQATSISSGGIQSDGGSSIVEVSDYVKATGGLDSVKLVVQKTTVIDISEGNGYSVYYNDKEYAMASGTSGTIVDAYGKKVEVSVPDDSHLTISGVDNSIRYLPGETISQITLQSEEGYYFPEDYCSNVTGNGAGSLIATRVSDTEVTISYTLATTEPEDITLIVASASVKPKEKGKGSIKISDIYYGAEVEAILASDTNDIQGAKVEYKKKGEPNSKYRTKKPTAVGSYTARATFAENSSYTSCTATTNFDITYLPVPNDAYVMKGTKGENGFYISPVEIIPRDGYSVANKLDGSYKKSLVYTSSQDEAKVYFKKNKTGEMTKGKKLPKLKIDIVLPVVSATHGQTYYGESLTVDISDVNLSAVSCNNVNVALEDGKAQLILSSEHGSSSYRIYARDLAGNSRQIDIVVADEWLQTGIIPENALVRLSPGTVYQLDNGVWKVAGDATRYSGGQSFYVRSEGEYTFGQEQQ